MEEPSHEPCLRVTEPAATLRGGVGPFVLDRDGAEAAHDPPGRDGAEHTPETGRTELGEASALFAVADLRELALAEPLEWARVVGALVRSVRPPPPADSDLSPDAVSLAALAAIAQLPRPKGNPDTLDARALDLRGCDLSGVVWGAWPPDHSPGRPSAAPVSLADCDLREALLRGAYLACADLSRADLRKADLEGADLAYAIAERCRANGACLRAAVLKGARFDAAHLAGADLRDADLRCLHGSRADLRGASLGGARLGGAMLVEANLDAARMAGADLRGANLKWVSLRNADLRDALLDDIAVRGADFRGAKVRPSDVPLLERGRADLAGVVLVPREPGSGA